MHGSPSTDLLAWCAAAPHAAPTLCGMPCKLGSAVRTDNRSCKAASTAARSLVHGCAWVCCLQERCCGPHSTPAQTCRWCARWPSAATACWRPRSSATTATPPAATAAPPRARWGGSQHGPGPGCLIPLPRRLHGDLPQALWVFCPRMGRAIGVVTGSGRACSAVTAGRLGTC